MSVLLYDTSGAKDVCINAFLVMNGYCQSAGLGYEIERFFFSFFFLSTLSLLMIKNGLSVSGSREKRETLGM